MSNHQIDLELGESILVGSHTVTVQQLDADTNQVVLEIEDPDGSVQLVTVDAAALFAEEPVLV